MRKHDRFCACVLVAIMVTALAAVPVRAAAGPYLAVGGPVKGAVYAVNQEFAAWPSWQDGEPLYLGGTLKYTWSPAEAVRGTAGNTAYLSWPDPADPLELFVSADVDGTDGWVRPIEASSRVGGADVEIVKLADSGATVSDPFAEPAVKTIAAGDSVTLSTEWRKASGTRPMAAPSGISYEWTMSDGEETISADATSGFLVAAPGQPGVFTYTCTAYADNSGSKTALCSVSYVVRVEATPEPVVSIISEPADHNGTVHISTGGSAVLSVFSEPALPAETTYQWQTQAETGWTDIPDAGEPRLTAAGSAAGTAYRCLITVGSTTTVTNPVTVMDESTVLRLEAGPVNMYMHSDSTSRICMQTLVYCEGPDSTGCEWEYRLTPEDDWQPASGLSWFEEQDPERTAGDYILFSWSSSADSTPKSGQYRCLVTNGEQSVTTDPAQLTVFPGENPRLHCLSPLEEESSSLGTTLQGFTARPPADPLPTYALRECFDVQPGYLVQVQKNGTEATGTETVGTGYAVELIGPAGDVQDGATLILCGDVLGTGVMSLSQLVRLAQAFNGSKPLSGPYELAADLNRDGQLTLSDLVSAAQLLRADAHED